MRASCYRCFWPQALCWCGSIKPVETRTRFVFLMHPKEYKREKAGTGRLTHLCLSRSELHMGISFDEHEAVQALISDPANFCVLLHPGRDAIDLSAIGRADSDTRLAAMKLELQQRRLVVFIIDATWALGRKMLRLSASLQRLPRIMFTPREPSRFLIKQQPHPGCLSTLEATHQLLAALERTGIDHYPLPEQLPGLFTRMQDFQIKCAMDPAREGYRRSAYTLPAERAGFRGQSAIRRARMFQQPGQHPPPADAEA